MNLRRQFRFPFVDLAIVVAMFLIAWAAWRLAKAEPEVSRDRQEAWELQKAFRRGRTMAGGVTNPPAGLQRESYALRQEARELQQEYSAVADRLDGELPDLGQALAEVSAPKGGEGLTL